MSKVVGDHLLCEADVLVFQHVYQGATYVVTARIDDATLVYYQLLTGANATTAINNAFGALTAARTWKETVTVKGNYTGLGQIVIPSQTILEIDGYLEAQNALNTHLITNSDPVGGNSDITIRYGWVNANKENQAGDMSCIHLQNVQRPEVYEVKVRGGARPVGVEHGEGICLWDCDYGKVVNCYCYEAYYDNIKIRGGSTHCLVEGNTCKDSETKGGIQVSSEGTAYINVIGNVIYQNYHSLDNGIRIHDADHCLVDANTIYCYNSSSIQLIDAAQFNTVSNNVIYTNGYGIYTFGNNPATARPSYNYFKSNTIHLATNVANTGIAIANGDYNEIKDNTIYGFASSTGILFSATYCSYNRLGPNNFYNLGTNVNIPDGIDVEFIDCQTISGSNYSVSTANVTHYGTPIGSGSTTAAEEQMRKIFAKPGIFRNFYCKTNTPAGAGESFVFTYRHNSADTTVVVTISGAAETADSDRAHGFTIAAADNVCVKIVTSAAPAQAYLQWTIQFLPF
jgi:hypothetical protein